MPVIDLKNVTFAIQDGTSGSPNSIFVKIGDGNIKYSTDVKREYLMNRGLIYQTRLGDQTPMDISFEFYWEFIMSDTGDASPTVEDALNQINLASTWVSSNNPTTWPGTTVNNQVIVPTGDACAPYTVDLVLINTPNCTGVKTEHITFPMFGYEKLDHDPKAGHISCSGKCNAIRPVVTRV